LNSEVSGIACTNSYIDPRFTFDNFVVGAGNEACYIACRTVAEKPGEIFNPLFIYGDVGLGKTHLVNAIANSLIKRDDLHIVYCTSERLVNKLIQFTRDGSKDFLRQYMYVDVLIVDDIQFITESINSRETLFQIFSAFGTVKKQIILTSDRNPKTMTTLMEKIPVYFNNALTVEVHQPDLETRLEILTMRANKADVNMNKDAAHWVAINFTALENRVE
jgi:chromosomal replication initiator protein